LVRALEMPVESAGRCIVGTNPTHRICAGGSGQIGVPSGHLCIGRRCPTGRQGRDSRGVPKGADGKTRSLRERARAQRIGLPWWQLSRKLTTATAPARCATGSAGPLQGQDLQASGDMGYGSCGQCLSLSTWC
jgi:hypothetical protein